MKLKTMAMTGVMSLAGLGLVGAGAHAVFTQNTSSAQTVTAGSMNVVVSAPGAVENGSDCSNSGENCTAITLPSFGPVGSTFATTPEVVTVTNNSNIPVTEVSVALTDTNNNAGLQSDVWACFFVPKTMATIGAPLAVESTTNPWVVVANEPLTTVEAYGATFTEAPLASGGQDQYGVVFYAGDANTGCGNTYSLVAPYGSSSGIFYPGYGGSIPSAYQLFDPTQGSGTGNSAAGTLGPTDQGGTITPTMTYTFTG
jgi:predicted ribosomally synthesized peptide with SipW-like signal peptide